MPESTDNLSKTVQKAHARSTEGQRLGSTTSASHNIRGESAAEGIRRSAGRPPGSKNKSKGILPAEMANQILLAMKEMLPQEHYDYMKGVIKEGKAISTKTELDTLILLLSRNLYPALVMEQVTDIADDDGDDVLPEDAAKEEFNQAKLPPQNRQKIRMPVFRKDVTERLKVLNSLLGLRNQVEKRDSDSKDDEKPLFRVLGSGKLDPSRVRLIIGVESGTVVGDVDGARVTPDEAGSIPDTIPERQERLPSGEQG